MIFVQIETRARRTTSAGRLAASSGVIPASSHASTTRTSSSRLRSRNPSRIASPTVSNRPAFTSASTNAACFSVRSTLRESCFVMHEQRLKFRRRKLEPLLVECSHQKHVGWRLWLGPLRAVRVIALSGQRKRDRSDSGPTRQVGGLHPAPPSPSAVRRGQGPCGLRGASRDDDGRLRQGRGADALRGNQGARR